jgi:hypothetical protein
VPSVHAVWLSVRANFANRSTRSTSYANGNKKARIRQMTKVLIISSGFLPLVRILERTALGSYNVLKEDKMHFCQIRFFL